MSEDPTPTTDEQSPASGNEPSTGEQMVHYAQWTAFALLILIALVATVRFYFAVSATVDTFVTRRYRSLFMIGFNLAVLLSCALGLSALVRRLT